MSMDWEFRMWGCADSIQYGAAAVVDIGRVPILGVERYPGLAAALADPKTWAAFYDQARVRRPAIFMDFDGRRVRAWGFVGQPLLAAAESVALHRARAIAAFLIPYLDEWVEFVARLDVLRPQRSFQLEWHVTDESPDGKSEPTPKKRGRKPRKQR